MALLCRTTTRDGITVTVFSEPDGGRSYRAEGHGVRCICIAQRTAVAHLDREAEALIIDKLVFDVRRKGTRRTMTPEPINFNPFAPKEETPTLAPRYVVYHD